jgi:hypothetical protein
VYDFQMALGLSPDITWCVLDFADAHGARALAESCRAAWEAIDKRDPRWLRIIARCNIARRTRQDAAWHGRWPTWRPTPGAHTAIPELCDRFKNKLITVQICEAKDLPAEPLKFDRPVTAIHWGVSPKLDPLWVCGIRKRSGVRDPRTD